MKIFVYEHITGGGCLEAPLPEALLHEAQLMLRALATDLADLPDVQVIGLRDQRLDRESLPAGWEVVRSRRQWRAALCTLIQASEAIWPIAPETGGVLEALSERVVGEGRVLLGSRPRGVRVAASKLATAQRLERAGVAVAQTFRPGDGCSHTADAWVVKPDDGCGCEEVRVFGDHAAALDWVAAQRQPERFVLQPYFRGEAMSLSALAREGKAWLLSVNRQSILRHGDGRLTYQGGTVNVSADADGGFQRLVQRIATVIPELWGYFGVDLILTDIGPVVLEVNPRLTTSYAGLREALGMNAAAMVLQLLERGPFEIPQLSSRRPVAIDCGFPRGGSSGTGSGRGASDLNVIPAQAGTQN